MVERWREEGDPSDDALLAEARAFFSLHLLERTQARIAELSEKARGRAEVWALTARVYHSKGRTQDAQSALARARELAPGDTVLGALALALEDRSAVIDPEVEGDPDTAPDVLLGLAERHLAQGSFLKARRILERLKRGAPGTPRVDDLLWALDGDFTLEGSLSDLAERNLGIADLPDLPEEVEHTESVARTDAVLPDEPDGRSFPSLFRSLEPVTDAYADPVEVTMTRAVADLVELRLDETENTSPGDDTQIQRVVETQPFEPGDRIHEQVPPIASDFDLGAFRREMGVEPPEMGGVESEDDARIVFRHRTEADAAASRTAEPLDLDLDPPTDARSRESTEERDNWVAQPAAAQGAAPTRGRPQAKDGGGDPPGYVPGRSQAPARGDASAPPAFRRSVAYWIAALAALAGLGMLALLGIATVVVLGS